MLNAQTDIHRSLSKTRPRGIDTNGPESPRSPRSPLDSPMHQSGEHDDAARHAQFSLQPAGDYGAPFASGSLTPTTPTAPLASSRGVDLGSSFLAGAGSGFPSSAASTSTLPTVSLSASTSSKAGESKERADRQAASASSADNPYRSFRVTLEDPCYKVLPAALKKYKINDDWRQYALFICYGNTGAFPIASAPALTRSRALPFLRREASPPVPATERGQREPRVHAAAHQGHQVAHCCRFGEACRPSRQTSCERWSRPGSTAGDEPGWHEHLASYEAASPPSTPTGREGQAGGRGGGRATAGQSTRSTGLLHQHLPLPGRARVSPSPPRWI